MRRLFYDKGLLQNSSCFLLQNVIVITKCKDFLQNVTVITNAIDITKVIERNYGTNKLDRYMPHPLS